VTKISDSKNNERLNMADESFGMTVSGVGTRLMNDIHFPTVIVQMPEKRLRISMVYYIVLEPVSRLYAGNIPCLLYSSLKGVKKDVQTAELLPLRMVSSRTDFADVSLPPLLVHEDKRCIFQEGCTFKVKSIKSGRRVDMKQRPWKYYDLVIWKMMPDLLRELICLDIRHMPK